MDDARGNIRGSGGEEFVGYGIQNPPPPPPREQDGVEKQGASGMVEETISIERVQNSYIHGTKLLRCIRKAQIDEKLKDGNKKDQEIEDGVEDRYLFHGYDTSTGLLRASAFSKPVTRHVSKKNALLFAVITDNRSMREFMAKNNLSDKHFKDVDCDGKTFLLLSRKISSEVYTVAPESQLQSSLFPVENYRIFGLRYGDAFVSEVRYEHYAHLAIEASDLSEITELKRSFSDDTTEKDASLVQDTRPFFFVSSFKSTTFARFRDALKFLLVDFAKMAENTETTGKGKLISLKLTGYEECKDFLDIGFKTRLNFTRTYMRELKLLKRYFSLLQIRVDKILSETKYYDCNFCQSTLGIMKEKVIIELVKVNKILTKFACDKFDSSLDYKIPVFFQGFMFPTLCRQIIRYQFSDSRRSDNHVKTSVLADNFNLKKFCLIRNRIYRLIFTQKTRNNGGSYVLNSFRHGDEFQMDTRNDKKACSTCFPSFFPSKNSPIYCEYKFSHGDYPTSIRMNKDSRKVFFESKSDGNDSVSATNDLDISINVHGSDFFFVKFNVNAHDLSADCCRFTLKWEPFDFVNKKF